MIKLLLILAVPLSLQYLWMLREERRAHRFVRDRHGDLPPAESLRGESLIFLATIARYYR